MSFVIDTGSEGSKGPWFTWTSNGSAEKGFAPRSWVLREKNEDGDKSEKVIPAFTTGCVMDLDTLQLGWMKDGAKGSMPERRWNGLSVGNRPDDSKKASGSFAWSKAVSVRCAIGGGQAATWEQGSFGAFDAFVRLSKQIMAQHPGDGTLPLVKQVGTEKRELPSGSANIPILEIVKWVPRPDCLKADAPKIDTGDFDTAPKQAAKPAPAQAVHVDADAEF